MSAPSSGTGLEARLQRLFIALGIHAERGLTIRTGQQEARIVTDIDVLGVAYTQDFQRSVVHAECKGEKRAKTLDRVFWLAGVRSLLQAQRSLLVMKSHEPSSSAFAKNLDIETLSLNTLQDMEDKYSISEHWWPGRADYQRWDSLQPTRERYTALPGFTDEVLRLTRQVYALCYEEAWRVSSYGSLNHLLRLLHKLGSESKVVMTAPAALQVVRVAMSYGLVRLSHYLLNVCRDLVLRQPLDRSAYLSDRLIFGDQDAARMRLLTQQSVRMVKSALQQHDVTPPGRWDADIMLQPPTYHPALLETIQRLLSNPEQTINLPLAIELAQFGYEPEPRGVVVMAVDAGRSPIELVKALLVQEFSIPSSLLQPPDTKILSSTGASSKRPKRAASQTQTELIQEEQQSD